jgi:DNA-binding SARP family transcriptional activator
VPVRSRPSGLTIQFLGRPRISRRVGETYRFRSQKSWAVLAYLILSERPPTRGQLASLLFADADDPGRALRWSLAEIRRAIGPEGVVDGDPVTLSFPAQTIVDVETVMRGSWTEAVTLPGLGAELLEGLGIRGAAVFDTWLLGQQRHLAAASEAVLHEAALSSMSVGELERAVGYAIRAATMSPLDENHQALLIRLYRLLGDDESAVRQFQACQKLFNRELGVDPGPAIEAALRTTTPDPPEPADDATIEAVLEAGSAAVAAGALDAGVSSLRRATAVADGAGAISLQVRARLALAEAYIHALGGLDQEGLAQLYEADRIARDHGLAEAVAYARAELGYVDFLRGRYDRAERWLNDAVRLASGDLPVLAKATTYLGCVASDRADYPSATALLTEAVELARTAGEYRREAFAWSMLGRISLLNGRLDQAAAYLETSITLAERDHWLSFLPWPQALAGEAQLLAGDVSGASRVLRQAFARACQLGDPCWEGISARGLALVAEAQGETERAFEIATDARVRANRLADPYTWLDGYILDVECELGLRHGHPIRSGGWRRCEFSPLGPACES